MNADCISVIIPVYNCDQLVGKCIDSVLAQTHRDLELILVDDGSTDASGAVCDGYPARDARVKVLHQKNSGASCARNAGMAASTGAYLTFIDADDTVKPDYLEYLFRNLNENGVDVATCGLTLENQDGSVRQRMPSFEARVMETKEILDPYARHFQSCSVCKLYRRRALENPDGTLIQFRPGLRIGEDRLFWCDVLLKNGRACISGTPKYHYLYLDTSAYHSMNYEKSYEGFVSRRLMAERLRGIPELRDIAVVYAIVTGLETLSYNSRGPHTDEIFAYIRENRNWITFARSKRRWQRRVQAVLIGIHPKLYYLARRIFPDAA